MSVLRQHARTVVFRQLPPSLEVKQVISSLPSGSIHNIIPKPNESLVINFLDSNTASRFTRNFLSLPRAPPIKDVSIEYGSPKPLPVEILAEIGLRGASRVVRVSSNNGKDIPNGLEDELKKIGGIESFEINPDGRSAAVHFMSIDEAVEVRDYSTFFPYSLLSVSLRLYAFCARVNLTVVTLSILELTESPILHGSRRVPEPTWF